MKQQKPQFENRQEAQEFYDQCKSVSGVADRLGMKKDAAWRMLKRLGVKLQSQGGSHPRKPKNRNADASEYCQEMNRPCVFRPEDGNCDACRLRMQVQVTIAVSESYDSGERERRTNYHKPKYSG